MIYRRLQEGREHAGGALRSRRKRTMRLHIRTAVAMYIACLAGAPPELMATASGVPQNWTDSVRDAGLHYLLGLPAR